MKKFVKADKTICILINKQGRVCYSNISKDSAGKWLEDFSIIDYLPVDDTFSFNVGNNSVTVDKVALDKTEYYLILIQPQDDLYKYAYRDPLTSLYNRNYWEHLISGVLRHPLPRKFTLVVICNEDVKMNLKNKRFIKWTRDSAIQDMSCFDIGIMPLDDTEFSRYKCGFKIIQYIAMSIPVIASPVGVNVEMIENGISGFLADSLSDWEHSLEILIKDKNLRDKMAYAAYIRNKKFYDLNAINEKYEEVMKTMMTNHY